MENNNSEIGTLVLRPSVLVIDDEEIYIDVMRQILSELEFDVYTADRAEDALRQLRDVAPDLILLDINMPGVDGLMLLRLLQTDASRAQVPILIVSGMLTAEDSDVARRSGASGFLAKPFTLADLKTAISQFLPMAEHTQ